MFSPEETELMNTLCNNNPDTNYIISKFKQENRQILSSFTHEVSNYFTLIYSTVQLLESNNPNIMKVPYWNQLSKDTKNLSGLLRELSTYNQSSKLNISKVDLLFLLTDVKDSFYETSLQKNITLSIQNLDTSVPYLYDYLGDNIKLRQVFFNIIKNAFEATNPGDFINIILPKETKDFFLYEKDTTFMTISIENNGAPIPHDKIDSIFSPFLTTKPTGTGLGLSIVHKIICAHGGKIKVHSTKELTTFTIYLPVEDKSLLSTDNVAS